MILGSHHSISYLKSNKLYNIFSFCWRTQINDIEQQFKNGARCFEFMIKNEDNQWVFACGLSRFYNETVINVLNTLNKLAVMNQEKVYVKITLYEKEEDASHEILFKEYCKMLKQKYTGTIHFFGGTRSFDDVYLFYFGEYPNEVYETSESKSFIGKLFPYFYHKHHKNNTVYKGDVICFKDFI